MYDSRAKETVQFAAAAQRHSLPMSQQDISGLIQSVGVERLTVFLELCAC